MPPLSVANVLTYVIQVSLIAGATGVCMTLVRVRSPLARYWAWRALLALAVILPLVQPWEAATVIIAPPLLYEAAAAMPAVASVAGTLASSAPAAWNPVLVVIIAGMTIRLLWLAAGAIRLRRIAARAASDPSDAASLQELIATAADVRYSDDLAQPATCGLRHPVVLLPVRLRALHASIRRAVLAHELVHVKRGDWGALMVEELLRAGLWFNPAVWWLIDRIHVAREEVVDAEAVLYVDGRRSYISALLAFADAPSVAAAPAFAHRRHLFSRIKRLCEESTMSSRRFLITTGLLAVAIATSTVYAVSAFPIQAGQDILVAPAAPAEKPAVVAPMSAVPQQRPAGGKVSIDLRGADLRTVLRTLVEHDGRTVVFDPGVDGKVTMTVKDTPADQALAFLLRAKKLTAITDGDTVRITPLAADDRPSVAMIRQDPPTPPPAVRMRQTPTLIRQVNPTYPAEAMRAGIEGTVEVEITIGDAGTVTHARVVRSAEPVFDQAAIKAAEQWTFSKPTQGPVVRTVELTFSLARGAVGTPRVRVRADADAVRIGGNIAAPMKTKHVSPAYPEIARNARVAGMVILEVLVARDGRVLDAAVLRSIPLLDQAAIDAVMQWEFVPTLLNGTPIQAIMTVTVNFTTWER